MKSFDVLIVGGGIVGCAIAWELARRKLSVAILDRNEPWREASWAAAGMLSPSPEPSESPRLFPLAKASFDLYPEWVSEIESVAATAPLIRHEKALELFAGPEAETERDAFVSLHQRLGLTTNAISPDDAVILEPTLGARARAVALLSDEATVDPRALGQALLQALARRGVEIQTGKEVTSLTIDNQRCTGVIASGRELAAGHVVVAAGCYSGSIEGIRGYAPVRPVRGQMAALWPLAAAPRRVLRSHRGYIVPRPDGRIIAGSTLENEGYEKRVTPSGQMKILGAAIELSPSLADAEIVETWSGLRPDTPDHLPIIGSAGGPGGLEGVTIATGHYRNGILLGPITARLVAESIVGEALSLDITPFSPLRFVNVASRAERG
jgi:glycine oxidase